MSSDNTVAYPSGAAKKNFKEIRETESLKFWFRVKAQRD